MRENPCALKVVRLRAYRPVAEPVNLIHNSRFKTATLWQGMSLSPRRTCPVLCSMQVAGMIDSYP